MGVELGAYIHWMVECVYQHRESVELLFYGIKGTSYENFVHNMVELEVGSTFGYMETLCRLGYSIPELSPSPCHITANGMLGGLIEIVVHDIPQEQTSRDMEQLRKFYTTGWLKLMSP